MTHDPKDFSIWRILKDDQKAYFSLCATMIFSVVSFVVWLDLEELKVNMEYWVIVSCMGVVAIPVFIWRLYLAIDLRRHGLLIKGYVESRRPTAKGHCEVHYHFDVDGVRTYGSREVINDSSILPPGDIIWLLVARDNYDRHFVIELPEPDNIYQAIR